MSPIAVSCVTLQRQSTNREKAVIPSAKMKVALDRYCPNKNQSERSAASRGGKVIEISGVAQSALPIQPFLNQRMNRFQIRVVQGFLDESGRHFERPVEPGHG